MTNNTVRISHDFSVCVITKPETTGSKYESNPLKKTTFQESQLKDSYFCTCTSMLVQNFSKRTTKLHR